MRQIELTRGYVASVDGDDYETVSVWKWNVLDHGNRKYAQSDRCNGGKKYRIYMHRLIMQPPSGFEVDHIDGDGLNNQRANLRIATRSQNLANRHHGRKSRSGFFGVKRASSGDRYTARITFNYNEIHIGTFDTAEEAARARDNAVIMAFGEFARLNFPDRRKGG